MAQHAAVKAAPTCSSRQVSKEQAIQVWDQAAIQPCSDRYTARVELSTKVVDNLDKLQRTLCHELCHVATWLLDHVAKPPHGPHFKAWAAAAMKVHPHLNVTTCHQYDIHFAWRWQCSNPE